ncbi:DNA repair protein RecO [bioreactor metagenome]|uniref:DNA repair protein RecO n=1 Tax=bioreactor metagenome TaxID=1076179 RepID=A0A645E3D4_9ZZZZ
MLTLFTREAGKLRAIAKGVRKMQSRKAGHLEPFTQVTLMLAQGHDLWIVTQAEATELFQPLRENLTLIGYAGYVVELLDRFTYEEGQNWQLYQLLVETLGRLASEPDPFVPIHYYEMRMLDLMGFRPMLFDCASCGKPIQPEDQYFSAERGGVLCPDCGLMVNVVRPISMDALRYLRHFQRSSYSEAKRANPGQDTRDEVEAILNYYLTYLLERNLNSPEFIRQVK